MIKIVLLGAPGSGKGTQAAMICKKFGIPHVSTGDIFRANIKDQTPVGILAKEFIDRGHLVPDDVTLSIVENRLSEKDCKNGYLLDGFPRTITQAEEMTKSLAAVGSYLTSVISLEVPYKTLLERIIERRVCGSCGSSFNLQLEKPKVEGKCDKCGGNLFIREDDKPETVAARLEVYKNQSEPLKDYYESNGLLVKVNGEQAVDKVFADILIALEK